MKKLKYLPLLILLVFWTCERDDICSASTPTTPRLIIDFLDQNSPSDSKSVPNFTVYAERLLPDNPPTAASDATLAFNSNTNTNTIELPLDVEADGEEVTIRYVLEMDTDLRLDEDPATESNADVIIITYSSEFIYVSRACGYKSVFNDLNVEVESDANNWITNINVIETRVENETTTHVNIFH